MATSTYHCPNCSAPIAFNPDLQLFSCEYCLSQFTSEQMENYTAKQQEKEGERAKREFERQQVKEATDEETSLHEYNCSNCGAHVVTDETTSATFCYYCHSPVIIGTRLQGDFRPDQILPFAISEAKAKEGFLAWTRTKKYLPEDFTSEAQLEKMTGIYIPYWFLDSDVEVDFEGRSKSVRTWRVGDYMHTETTAFQHVREGVYHLTDVNLPAFSKIDQNLLHGIEPYEPEGLVPFTMPMLSGFFAEQYTISEQEAGPPMRRQIQEISSDLLNRSFGVASSVDTLHERFVPTDKEWLFTLLPVWVLTYQYEGKTYVYSMNGQTGKAFGELPIVERKLTKDAWLRGLLLGLILAIVIFLVYGFFL